MSETTKTSPNHKQAALDLACALLSTGQFTDGDPEADSQVAVGLLNHLEHLLKIQQTPHR